MTTIDRFAAHYHSFNNISPARATEQINLLRAFEVHAGIPLEQADDSHVRAFLGKLINDGQHPNTVRKKRGMILPFYGWCFDERIVSAEVLMRVQRVKNPRGATSSSTPKPYTRKEMIAFWAGLDKAWPLAPDERLKRWRQGVARYRRVARHCMNLQINCISHLALHAGMRRDEIYYADLADIHYDNAYVVVRHSARKNTQGTVKPREVPMTAELSDAIQRWLEIRELVLKSGPVRRKHARPWLSLASNQKKNGWMTPMSHERFGELLGTIPPGFELHRLRHTCATEWLRAGMDIELVKELLGHAKLQQTLAYAEIIKTDLEKGMNGAVANFSTAVGRSS